MLQLQNKNAIKKGFWKVVCTTFLYMLLMSMMLRTILFIAPHHWMKSGWMMKVADKVEMSFAISELEMMLGFEIKRGLRGRK